MLVTVVVRVEVPASRQKALDRGIITAEEFDNVNQGDAVDCQAAIEKAVAQIAKDFSTTATVTVG